MLNLQRSYEGLRQSSSPEGRKESQYTKDSQYTALRTMFEIVVFKVAIANFTTEVVYL